MTTRGEMKIQYMPLEEVEQWPRNPKLHDIEALDDSVQRFGFVQPLLIDEKSNLLIAGHGRLETLAKMKKAGEKPPKRIEFDGTQDRASDLVSEERMIFRFTRDTRALK